MNRLNIGGQGVHVDPSQSSHQLGPAGILIHVQPLLHKVLLPVFSIVILGGNVIQSFERNFELEEQFPCLLHIESFYSVTHIQCRQITGGSHILSWKI